MQGVGLNLLIFPPLPQCEEDVQPSIWDKNKDCGGTEAREAFLWKNIHRYVAPDQPSYPGAKIYLLLHWWWIWSTHKLRAGKKTSSVSLTPAGIQGVSPPEISLAEKAVEPFPDYPSHVHDLRTSLETVILNGKELHPGETMHIAVKLEWL